MLNTRLHPGSTAEVLQGRSVSAECCSQLTSWRRPWSHGLLGVVCRQVSIWREAKGKLSCATTPELTKTISAVHCLEPVIDLTVAVGCEGGRVLLLRIMEDTDSSSTSSVAKMMMQAAPSHDDKLRILQVHPVPHLPGDQRCACADPWLSVRMLRPRFTIWRRSGGVVVV